MGHIVHKEQGVNAGCKGNHRARQVNGRRQGDDEFANLTDDAHLAVTIDVNGNRRRRRLGTHCRKISGEHFDEGLRRVATGNCSRHHKHREDVNNVEHENTTEDANKNR